MDRDRGSQEQGTESRDYVNKGISKDLLKEWFGHASIKSTEVYAKIKIIDAFRQIQNDKVVEIKTVSKPSPTA